MAEINDFGEKIGGARKDIWRSRGLSLHDITEMTALERESNIKKDNIWVKPNWEQRIADGTPQSVAYWQNQMRLSLPPRPASPKEEAQDNYITVVSAIRDAVMAVQQPHEIDRFYADFLAKNYIQRPEHGRYVTIDPIANDVITNKVLRAAQTSGRTMKYQAEKKLFGIPKTEQLYVTLKKQLTVHQYDGDRVELIPGKENDPRNTLIIGSSYGRSYFYLKKDSAFGDIDSWDKNTYFVVHHGRGTVLKNNFQTEQEAQAFIEAFARTSQEQANSRDKDKSKPGKGKRKGAFVPPQLRNFRRTGPDYRKGRNATGALYLETLKFRGGEFGNWLNHDDRRVSLNMAYDALRDLARLLEIKPEDIALDQSLAIAFGARGRGGANAGAAHYEPDRQVINLTKMSGAGCLAHEWGHALDHAIGIAFGVTGLASEHRPSRFPESFDTLMDSLRYKQVLIPPGELSPEEQSRIDRSKTNLLNWIKQSKPHNLSADMEKHWEQTTQAILESVATFTGTEYMAPGKAVKTKPEVEMLSQICKSATGRSIPKATKLQIALWASELNHSLQATERKDPSYRREKTDFYKGSKAFDELFSRAGHGYYQSECEMFARAFDCYISDKLKKAGLHSEYLTAYADSFSIPGHDGNMVSAIPKGDERSIINQNFDRLLEDLKQRGILHEFIEPPEILESKDVLKQTGMRRFNRQEAHCIPSTPVHYEQLSLDDMLFSAQSRTSSETQLNNSHPNHSR